MRLSVPPLSPSPHGLIIRWEEGLRCTPSCPGVLLASSVHSIGCQLSLALKYLRSCCLLATLVFGSHHRAGVLDTLRSLLHALRSALRAFRSIKQALIPVGSAGLAPRRPAAPAETAYSYQLSPPMLCCAHPGSRVLGSPYNLPGIVLPRVLSVE